MNLKKILMALLALSLTLAFASCGGNACDGHVDKNDDGKCDNCGAAYDDGDEVTLPEKKTRTVTLVDSDGGKVAGAKLTLTLGSETLTLTTDADGKATADLFDGKYSIVYDFDTLPSGFLPSDSSIEIKADSTTVELLLINNNPNGTNERPFIISEDETPLTLAAGAEVFYALHGGAGKFLTIENDKVTVTYNGTTYEPVDGKVEFQLSTSLGSANKFAVNSLSDDEMDIVIKLQSPLGSYENPIVMTEDTAIANAPIDGAICYSWTAELNGVVVVTSSNSRNNITLTNRTTNAVSMQTDGSGGEYIAVSAGDEVIISVSAKEEKGDDAATVEIEFAVALYDGSEANPIPVIKNIVDVVIAEGASYTFSFTEGGTLTISDEENVTVTYGGTTYTPDSYGMITVELADGEGSFTVTNTAEGINGVMIEIE